MAECEHTFVNRLVLLFERRWPLPRYHCIYFRKHDKAWYAKFRGKQLGQFRESEHGGRAGARQPAISELRDRNWLPGGFTPVQC